MSLANSFRPSKALIDRDCDSIIVGMIRHHEHNFHLFSEKYTASISCTFDQFCSTKLLFTDHATIFFGPRSLLQANLSNKQHFFCLLISSFIHGTLFPQEVTREVASALTCAFALNLFAALSNSGVFVKFKEKGKSIISVFFAKMSIIYKN